MSETLRT